VAGAEAAAVWVRPEHEVAFLVGDLEHTAVGLSNQRPNGVELVVAAPAVEVHVLARCGGTRPGPLWWYTSWPAGETTPSDGPSRVCQTTVSVSQLTPAMCFHGIFRRAL
jgi:hypothetical protein